MKKKLLITGGVILAVLVLLAGCLFGVVAYFRNRGFGISEGIYLEGTSSPILMLDGSPFVMGDRSKDGDLFAGLQTGDRILVLHDGLCESYPGQTGAYWIKRLGSGSAADIPASELEALVSMGWVSQETVDQASSRECEFSAQYIRTDGYQEGAQYPRVTVIRSVTELDAYYEANKERYNLEKREDPASDSTIGFLNACEKYDDAYFKDRILLLILLEEGSGSIRHQVTGVTAFTDGVERLAVRIDTITPEVGTCDMAEWHLFVEIEAGVDVACAEAVQVWLNGEDRTIAPEYLYFSDGDTVVCLPKLPGWEYKLKKGEPGTFGVSFRPEGCEGAVNLYRYENFAVCGTGLREQKITVAGYQAWQGTYDNHAVWDYISLIGAPGEYVFLNEGAEEWWAEYGSEAMFIIHSLMFAQN